MDTERCGTCVSRRAVLAGAGAGAALLVTGCQAYGQPSVPPAAPGAAAGTVLATLADIPVGGGTILADKGIVVTQPTPGEVKAFSAICTHAGCTVSSVAGGTINCECHQSKFRVADGSVADGPAPRPLEPAKVTVDGDAISLA
jgi:nitrite reductase/ring-hydroxylating ferredoxin subunit